MSQGNADINHPLTATMMWFYERRKGRKKIIMMRELFLGKIIDLILSLGIFRFYSEHKNIVL